MVASTVCVMDATTILGRRVNEGESAWTTQDLVNGEAPSLWQGEIKNQKKLCKHSCRHPKGAQRGVQNPQNELCKHSARHPTCPLSRPVDRGWRSSPGPAKKAQCVVQNCQNGLRKRSTRRPTCPLGRPVDRVWMGAAQGLRKGPCGGVKSPKTGCTSAALDVSMVVTSHHHGYIHVRQGGCNQPIWLQPSTWFQTTDLTPIGPTSPSLSGPYGVTKLVWHHAWETKLTLACRKGQVPHKLLCRSYFIRTHPNPITATPVTRHTVLSFRHHHGSHPQSRKAYKSIIRWLPNEILTAIIRNVPTTDLLALCRTSRLMRNLATPLLYRSITLSTVSQLKNFIRTMERRSKSTPPLSDYVRDFEISSERTCESFFDGLPESTNNCGTSEAHHHLFYNLFSPSSSHFRYIEVLDLLEISFTDMLLEAYFPNLHTFLGSVQPHNSVSLPSFLNYRHQTINHLTLSQDGAPVPLDPICLPNLKEYSGPSSSLPAFGANSSHISCVTLFWYSDDLNVELAAPPAQQDGLTRQDIREMATHLKELTVLSVFELLGPNDGDSSHDLTSIKPWSEACKNPLFNHTPYALALKR
ncbi:hypothetical protein B0H14DRAFT_2610494 [Mycena olivaceomarginata]|nr:hypothetical protein B0H14DRAFT_2610494 [Mycena olivaceomarginata]